MVILCKSKRSAERTLTNIVPYIEEKLFLKVNREKTVVAYISKIKFLGYSFYVNKKVGRLRIHPKCIAKMKERIKTLTSRSNGWGDDRRKETLKQYITGWVNYFKLADMKTLLLQIDEWYRRRLRMVIWKQWKRLRTRFRNLQKLGLENTRLWSLRILEKATGALPIVQFYQGQSPMIVFKKQDTSSLRIIFGKSMT